ncbi:MAG: hypothetical protein IJ684_03855 [Bacteroidales bacterium]|nr:hypothetical protein [Bacteroidales bacterium]
MYSTQKPTVGLGRTPSIGVVATLDAMRGELSMEQLQQSAYLKKPFEIRGSSLRTSTVYGIGRVRVRAREAWPEVALAGKRVKEKKTT